MPTVGKANSFIPEFLSAYEHSQTLCQANM